MYQCKLLEENIFSDKLGQCSTYNKIYNKCSHVLRKYYT